METKITGYLKILMMVLLLGGFIGCTDSEPICEVSPCEPEAALKTLDVVEGFQVELFAAEPLIRDPVAMEIDEEGRLYVVEDPGYPENPDNYQGRVRLLEDTNGDGKPDQSIVFADQFRAPRGIMRWKDGILVTDATDILYLEDTNGDGQADVRRVVMTGFGYGNPQLGVNTPIYGLDNWIYVALTQRSRPHFKGNPEPEETVSTNIRFRPDTRKWESLAAAAQFGHSFNAFGRHLLSAAGNHIYQEIISARYLRRNPDLLVAPAATSISDHGSAAEVFSITKNPRYELFTDKSTMTSTCGITCYLGGSFPSEYQGITFVAEPTHNLVHVDRLEENGTTLLAKRMYESREFLASTDPWFRPVNFYVGPDGALYVIDYYREIIEQPRFLSEEALKSGKIYNGTDRGRIYRVVSKDKDANASWLGQLDLKEAPVDELVALLEHENAWWRRTAQRLLVDRQDIAAVALLEQLVESSASTPETRVHALWTLQGINALPLVLIESALKDKSPRVREQAIRLAELHLDVFPELARSLLELADDPDLRVQFQLICTLGDLHTPESRAVRQRILYNNIDDEWMQLAALSAGDLEYQRLFEEALSRLVHRESTSHATYFQRLGMLIGARQQPEQVSFLMQSIASKDEEAAAWWQAASLEGLATGLRHGADPSERILHLVQEPVASLSLHPTASLLRKASQQVMAVVGPPSGSGGKEVLRRAAEIVLDRRMEAELRADAIRLLNLAGSSLPANLLKELVNPQEPGLVQAAAVRTLGSIKGEQIGKMLLSRWSQMSPQVRTAAVDALLADGDRVRMVLDAVEEGKLQRSDISWNHTRSLMLHSNDELRLRAQSLLGLPPRSEVVDRYEVALGIDGSAEKGREVFDSNCAMCHQIDGAGGMDIGPDLATVQNRRYEDLLVDILMPNSEITTGYEQWRVERNSGGLLQGVISSETPGAITFRNQSGQKITVSRNDIKNIEAVNMSLMPTGLERQISVEEMADLLEYLRRQ